MSDREIISIEELGARFIAGIEPKQLLGPCNIAPDFPADWMGMQYFYGNPEQLCVYVLHEGVWTPCAVPYQYYIKALEKACLPTALQKVAAGHVELRYKKKEPREIEGLPEGNRAWTLN